MLLYFCSLEEGANLNNLININDALCVCVCADDHAVPVVLSDPLYRVICWSNAFPLTKCYTWFISCVWDIMGVESYYQALSKCMSNIRIHYQYFVIIKYDHSHTW